MAGIRIGGPGPGDITVHDSRFYGRLLRDASLGVGESYMDGWWDTDALDVLLEKIMRAGLREKIQGSLRLRLLTAKAFLFNLQSKERSGKSVEAHYDIGNDLYTKMLDPRMVYTCGYWKNAKTLAEAQEAKLDLVCRKLGLQPGMRVLDLGCGWGGLRDLGRREVRLLGRRRDAVEGPARAGARDVEAPGRRPAPLRLPRRQRHVRSRRVDRHDGARRAEESPPRHGGRSPAPGRRRHRASSTPSPTTGAGGTAPRSSRSTSSRTRSRRRSRSSARRSRGCSSSRTCTTSAPTTNARCWRGGRTSTAPTRELKDKYDQRFYRMWKFYLLAAAGASRARDGQLYHLVLTKIGRTQPDCRMS